MGEASTNSEVGGAKKGGRFLKFAGGLGSVATALTAVVILFQTMNDASQPTPTPAAAATEAPPAPTKEAPPAPPAFQPVAANWTGQCTSDTGCPVQVTFRNNGGPGNGSATIYVLENGSNRELGQCTNTIGYAPAGGSATAACLVSSGDLSNYIRAYSRQYGPNGTLPVHIDAKVN